MEVAETSEAATALVKLQQNDTTTCPGFGNRRCFRSLNLAIDSREIVDLRFEAVSPDYFVQKELFRKFANDPRLLRRLLAMTVMVISYLDSSWKHKLQPNKRTCKLGLIKHLDYWYLHVNARNVKNKIDSYLGDEKYILSNANVTLSSASRDAQKYIGKIKNFVNKSMMETPTMYDFLDDMYQSVLLSSMRCSFYELDYYEPEFVMIIEQITNFVRHRFRNLLLIAYSWDHL